MISTKTIAFFKKTHTKSMHSIVKLPIFESCNRRVLKILENDRYYQTWILQENSTGDFSVPALKFFANVSLESSVLVLDSRPCFFPITETFIGDSAHLILKFNKLIWSEDLCFWFLKAFVYSSQLLTTAKSISWIIIRIDYLKNFMNVQ